MDIYILHKGQESGPYSEKTVSQLLDQGSIAASDLAWRQGLPDWLPLSELLAAKPAEPAPAADKASRQERTAERTADKAGKVEKTPEKEEPKAEEKAEPRKARSTEPATAKQKALLTFLRIALTPDLTKEDASGLINDAMEDPKHLDRLILWNEERFRLHPELFAAEIQAKKENRSNHFFELCETAGSEYFSGISKAHCKVLVSFLDVKFPNWDAVESEAAEHYFFPAVAEKFPQLVQKQWRGRLKYTDGSRVSSEIVKKSATSKIRQTRTSPLGAIAKGTVIGLIILAALYLGHRTLRQQATAASTPTTDQSAAQKVTPPSPALPIPASPSAPQPVAITPTAPPTDATLPPATSPVPVPPSPAPIAATTPEPSPATPFDPAPAMASASTSLPAPMGDAASMTPTTPMAPLPTGEPPAPVPPPPPTLPIVGSLPSTPPAPMGSSDLIPPILGPDPTTGAIPTPTPNLPPALPPTASTTTAAARINLLLTRPVEIQLAYGKIMLPPGTPVKLMSRQGVLLKVAYQTSVITVPVSSTDLE